MDVAIYFWPALLGAQYPMINDIVQFIGEKTTPVKAVTKDLWGMVRPLHSSRVASC